MRIGIFTYHFSENYGALMQAYALRQWLVNEGHDAQFINYHPKYVEEGGDIGGLFLKGGLRRNMKVVFLRVSAMRRRFFGSRERAAGFDVFRSAVLGSNSQRLFTRSDVINFLQSEEGRFDALICGSDQIWSPSDQFGIDPVYFLDVGNDFAGRKISFAPSFGRDSVDHSYYDQLRTLLSGIDALSCRELSGTKVVRDITGREACYVPDPTVLLGDFSPLLQGVEAASKGHVFAYELRTADGVREVAELVADKLGAPLISPYNPHRRWRPIGRTAFPCPATWARLIADAGFVVTNSFHGTAMSVILHTPFITVGLPGARSGLNERSRDLLNQVDLLDRFVEPGNAHMYVEKLSKSIDWNRVDQRLSAIKAVGEDFLRRELRPVEDGQ